MSVQKSPISCQKEPYISSKRTLQVINADVCMILRSVGSGGSERQGVWRLCNTYNTLQHARGIRLCDPSRHFLHASVFQRVAARYSVLQRVSVCCSVLQCVWRQEVLTIPKSH